MRFCYAHRRFALHPQSVDSWNLTADNYTDAFLGKVKSIGFDALEVGAEVLDKLGSDAKVKDFGKRVEGFGLKIGALRSGGTVLEARTGLRNREKMERSIKYAALVKAEVINGALSAPARYPGNPPGSLPASQHGWPKSQDSSKEAMTWVYDELSKVYRGFCDRAADSGTKVSIEVHQNSPVDNSWSAKLIHQMIDRPNFGINPDIGNVVWNYDIPEEDYDTFISETAPISVYWHCKNLHRIYHPENQRSVYLRVPLPDGEVDYRFAMSAMAAAGYSGYMAIEGAWAGDQWLADQKSLEYAKGIWAELESAGSASGNGAKAGKA